MTDLVALGIDVGGTGIKGGLVDLRTGELLGQKRYLRTPKPATPDGVAKTVYEVYHSFEGVPDDTPIGIDIPAVVRRGVVRTAANIDQSWIGTNGEALFAEQLGHPIALLNDADAARLAEMRFGAGQGRLDSVAVITLGTGIGSAVFIGGRMYPNTELGHLEHAGIDCCNWAAAAAVDRESLPWDAWVSRLQQFLTCFEALMWPDLIIIGGAISADAARFIPMLHTQADIVPAKLRGDASIVGSALAAAAVRSCDFAQDDLNY